MSSQPPFTLSDPSGGDYVFHDDNGWEIARFTPDRFLIKNKGNSASDLAFQLSQLTLGSLMWIAPIPFNLVEGMALQIRVGYRTVIEVSRDKADYDTNWCVGGYEIMVMDEYVSLLQKAIV